MIDKFVTFHVAGERNTFVRQALVLTEDENFYYLIGHSGRKYKADKRESMRIVDERSTTWDSQIRSWLRAMRELGYRQRLQLLDSVREGD